MGLVFISYARADRQYADRLQRELESLGHACWRDLRDLRDGEDFTGEIEMAIRRASHVVACLTADVERRLDSFVRREIQYALNRGARSRQETGRAVPIILPVVMPGGELPVSIATLTAIPITGDDDFSAGTHALSVRIKSGHRQPSEPAPVRGPEVTSYLRQLHDELTDALQASVHTLLTLSAVPTPDATASLTPLLRHFTISQVLARPAAPAAVPEPTTMAAAFAKSQGRLLLLGHPGAGKTTSLLAFARDAAVAALEDQDCPIPVIANIKTWDGESTLREWVGRQYDDRVIAGQRLLYLFDGLDELVAERKPQVEAAAADSGSSGLRADFLDRLSLELGDDDVVVTSRLEEFRRLEKAAKLGGAVTLQPLTTVQIREYLTTAGREWLWDALATDPQLVEITRTPLLLALFSIAFEKDDVVSRDLSELTETAVFDRYVARRFVHEVSRGEPLPYDEAGTRHLLAAFATESLWIYHDRGPVDVPAAFFGFAVRMHLLRHTSSGQYEFIHLKLRDFFALPRLLELVSSVSVADSVMLFMLAEQIGVPALPILEKALAHPHWEVRRDAVMTLQNIGGMAVVPLLLKAARDPEKNVRWDIERYLSSMGEAAAVSLIAAVTGPDDEIRRTAATQLENAGAAVAPALIPLLADSRPVVRATAANTLGRIGQITTDASFDPPLPALLVPLLRDDDRTVRATAAAALQLLPGVHGADELIRCLRDPEDIVRGTAATTLGVKAHQPATAGLIELLEDPDYEVRLAAAKALAGMPSAEALAAAIEYARASKRQPPLRGRDSVVYGLSKRADAMRAVLAPVFVSLLDSDPDKQVRESAAFAIKAIGAQAESPAVLERAAFTDPEKYVRLAAFEAILANDVERTRTLACHALDSGDEALAVPAIGFIIESLQERAVPILERNVREGWSHVAYKDRLFPKPIGGSIQEGLEKHRQEAWAAALLRRLPWVKPV